MKDTWMVKWSVRNPWVYIVEHAIVNSHPVHFYCKHCGALWVRMGQRESSFSKTQGAVGVHRSVCVVCQQRLFKNNINFVSPSFLCFTILAFRSFHFCLAVCLLRCLCSDNKTHTPRHKHTSDLANDQPFRRVIENSFVNNIS